MEGTTEAWRMVSVLMTTIYLGGKCYLPKAIMNTQSLYVELTAKLGGTEGMGQESSEDRGH